MDDPTAVCHVNCHLIDNSDYTIPVRNTPGRFFCHCIVLECLANSAGAGVRTRTNLMDLSLSRSCLKVLLTIRDCVRIREATGVDTITEEALQDKSLENVMGMCERTKKWQHKR